MHRRWVRAPVAFISQSATYGDPRSLDRPLHLPPSPLQSGLNSTGTWHPRTLYHSIYEQLYLRYTLWQHADPHSSIVPAACMGNGERRQRS